MAGVEEIEEGVLQHLGPHGEVVEVVALCEAADDGVGDVADSGLEGEEVGGEALGGDLGFEEFNEVRGDGEGAFVLGRVVGGHVGETRFDDADDAVAVDGDVLGADAVVGGHDEVGLAVGGEFAHGDVMETFEGGHEGVDFDDDFVGHLKDLGGGADGGTGDDTALFGDGRGLNDRDVDAVLGAVLGVVSLRGVLEIAISGTGRGWLYVEEILREHGEMLVKELDAALVDSLGDGLSDLMGRPALNHVQLGPTVLSLSAGGGADEKVVLHLALEVVLLDMVGHRDGHQLGVADTGESRPANAGAIGEVVEEVLGLAELVKEGGAADSCLERGRRDVATGHGVY